MFVAKKGKWIVFFVCFFMIHSFYATTNRELFENKKILILGGTGFLGRALVQEILKYNPHKIYIFSRDEVKQFTCGNLFRDHASVTMVTGDIRDYASVVQATRDIDIVFHAAALKRIDLLESNVQECIKTNIVGSLNVFNACVENNVPRVIFISSDKACSPINTYGASKFISEKIFTHYDKQRIKTKCMVARYGNVLESTGSVIPTFMEKIQKGEDIPLTDERMTRFIITKEEAMELIIDALRYGDGGEVFVKDLPALKVTDLITVLKAKCNSTNKVKLIGLRPGEKIHESLINASEVGRTYYFKGYYIITPSIKNESELHNVSETPLYIQEGKRVVSSDVDKYSSENTVISYSELEALFKTINLV